MDKLNRIYKNKETQKMVGAFCREFRIDVLGMTLREVMGQENMKTLSAFEMGRSSNMLILLEYWNLARKHGELNRFDVLLESAIQITVHDEEEILEEQGYYEN